MQTKNPNKPQLPEKDLKNLSIIIHLITNPTSKREWKPHYIKLQVLLSIIQKDPLLHKILILAYY